MKFKFLKAIGSIALAGVMAMGFAACNKDNGGTPGGTPGGTTGNGGVADNYTGPVNNSYNNETDSLVFSIQPVDGLFNPFFSTSATDGSVASMTQIGMLTNDENGDPVWGPDEPVISLDYQVKTTGTTKDVDLKTTYYFVLKNNVRFSNGSYLSIKDVLFNYYVYLDQVYTGSSTIYSTDIVGLKEYRTQTANENEQDKFMERFEAEALDRVTALIEAADYINDPNNNRPGTVDTVAIFREKLEEYQQDNPDSYYSNIVKDFDRATELFREEIDTDWTNSLGAYQDTIFIDEAKEEVKGLIENDVMQFLLNEGFIEFDRKAGVLTTTAAANVDIVKGWTEEQAKNYVYNANMPSKLTEIIQYWATAGNLLTELTNEQLSKYTATQTVSYPDISGIKFANRTGTVTLPDGTTYGVPEYVDEAHTQVKDGFNEVLTITINNIDPKAVWNFSIGVAPMYYYSDAEHIAAFDYESHFGVERSNSEWMNNVVKNTEKNGVPVGAGAYKASTSAGNVPDNVIPERGRFYDNNIIYYERNPYYLMGPAKIKKVNYRVTQTTSVMNDLEGEQLDFAEPNGKKEIVDQLNGLMSKGIGNVSVPTLGYGYVGINAGKVPSIYVRQAIMHSIDTSECVKYYSGLADPINRPMSTQSWAYPKDSTPYYPYIGNGIDVEGTVPSDLSAVNPNYRAFCQANGLKGGDKFTVELQSEFITYLVHDLGKYELNANGVYYSGNNVLRYTFTIVGAEKDHPAWQALFQAGQFLSRNGFQITTTNDINGLQKLNTGSLTVWAAAWGATIDPDMYQVYHKDSKATSTENWGYRQILQNAGNRYSYELGIVNQLSDIIDRAREIESQDDVKDANGYTVLGRKSLYSQALDLVMQLAVELPTYQRQDLYAYWASKIDITTFYQHPTCFKGITTDLHLVSLRQAVTTQAQ